MATPIAPTPTLYGKDADRFMRIRKENEGKKLSDEEMAKIKSDSAIFEQWLTFPF
ncbi:MAG: hypothetical protein UD961_06830 [Bacteroidales bacterium]|jgi:hypothetical protein|nr:hypothetical protein [Bacteroidales bacterium]